MELHDLIRLLDISSKDIGKIGVRLLLNGEEVNSIKVNKNPANRVLDLRIETRR